jgi:hypothetical protein
MTLISQPGSDDQIASISLDAGYTRDLILLLIDVCWTPSWRRRPGTQEPESGWARR